MPLHPCIGCIDQVDVVTRDLGLSIRGLTRPVRILCRPCARRLGLVVKTNGAEEWVFYEGAQFLLIGGAFAHSDHPAVAGAYDQPQQQ